MSLIDDLRRVQRAATHAICGEDRWNDPTVAADLDELAARRKQHAYLTRREADEARAEDEHERDLRGF